MSQKNSARGPVRDMIQRFRTGPQRRMRMRQASRARERSTACFVAVTGSSGKSTTVGLLSHILQAHAPIRRQMLNNTINSLIRTLKRHQPDERFVVAELGVGSKGNMAPMANMFRPDVAIVTMIGTEHYSAFRGREAVAREKGDLLEALRPEGFALLNADDDMVLEMASRSSARIVTFGKDNPHVDYRIENVHAAFPDLLSFTIAGRGQRLEVKTQFPGAQFWMPVAAAATAALELGVPAELIARQIETFAPVEGRCNLVRVPGGPTFILDTAKAPNGTLELAFDMLAQAKAPRKRLILGVISDYPGDSARRYRRAWNYTREITDQVIFVGRKISYAKPAKEDVESGRIIGFATPQEVFEHIKVTAQPDELILIKGSGNLNLARIALGFVQPVQCWEAACGMGGDCFTCPGLLVPFDRKALKRLEKRDRLMFWKSERKRSALP
nr:Mur ligase family protein [uncultured Celeribacter sp.]